MQILDWPYTQPFLTTQSDMWLEDVNVTERSSQGGGQQTTARPGAHWRYSMTMPRDNAERRQVLLGFLRSLNGKENGVRLWDMRKFGLNNAHGSPAGSINTVGVTVRVTANQFANEVSLQGCGVGKTLLQGDMLSINGQLIENCFAPVGDINGNLTVIVPQRLRATAVAGTPVTLVRPTAVFVLADVVHGPRSSALYEEMMIEWEEVFV